MVDTGMSSCFRGGHLIERERDRFIEILKIVHDKNKNKLFNKLYRLRTDNREIRIKPTDKDRGKWYETNHFKEKYEKYKNKYLLLKNKINKLN